MKFMLLHVIVLLGSTQASDYDFDNTDTCTIEENLITNEPFMKCICNNRENFTMNPVLDYDITSITVKGCGTVHVPFAALTNLQLEELEFKDIESLIILPFALSPTHGVETLKISDIANLDVKHHALVGLYNVEKLIVSNVTSHTLTRDAFSSISNVRYFLIEDSTFHYVEQLAFAVHNVTSFKVINSNFHYLENCSFLIHNSYDVHFENCLFEETNNNSFILSFVDSLHFQNCKFGQLATTCIQSNALQIFSISGCSIEELKPDAFDGIEVHDKLVFKNNEIQIVYDTSLAPFLSPRLENLDIDFCCNSFTCDCSLYWMWNLEEPRKNISILESNKCIGDSMKNLSLYIPVLDSYNNCMTLELKSLQRAPKSFKIDLPSIGSSLNIMHKTFFHMFLLITIFVWIYS